MPDYSFLLGAKPVDIPNPLDVAGKGATLADLLQRVQGGQFALQKQQQMAAAYSDPAVLAAFSQMGQGGAGAPGGAGEFDLSPFAKYNVAAPELVQQALKTRKEFADIAKTKADTAEAQRKVLDAQLVNLADWSNKAKENPTPQTLMGFARQFKMTNLPEDFFGQMPDPGDMEGWKAYLGQAGSILTSETQRQEIVKSQTMTPLEAAASRAGTAKTWAEVGQMPAELRVKQSQAASAAMQAATHQADVFGPKISISEVTGMPVAERRFGPGGPSVTPIAGGTGTTDETPSPPPSPQMKLTPTQAAMVKAQGPVLDASTQVIGQAQRILTLATPLKALIASGYNGPLAASPLGRQFLAQASASGLVSQEMQDKWANSKASEVFSQDMLGAIIKEFGNRGGVAIASVAALGKPGLENNLQSRMAMVNAIETDATNSLKMHAAKIKYMRDHPDDPLATDFKPPMAGTTAIAGKKTLGAIPTQAVQYLRAHPEARADFDAKYGDGAATVVLGK